MVFDVRNIANRLAPARCARSSLPVEVYDVSPIFYNATPMVTPGEDWQPAVAHNPHDAQHRTALGSAIRVATSLPSSSMPCGSYFIAERHLPAPRLSRPGPLISYGQVPGTSSSYALAPSVGFTMTLSRDRNAPPGPPVPPEPRWPRPLGRRRPCRPEKAPPGAPAMPSQVALCRCSSSAERRSLPFRTSCHEDRGQAGQSMPCGTKCAMASTRAQLPGHNRARRSGRAGG